MSGMKKKGPSHKRSKRAMRSKWDDNVNPNGVIWMKKQPRKNNAYQLYENFDQPWREERYNASK